MPTRETRAQTGQASGDVESSSSLRLGDFALLDKLLLLEASLQRSPGLSPPVRMSLLQQVAALKDDLRLVSIVLLGDAPPRTRPVPIPTWARSETPDEAKKERPSGG
jgi:hypothetical protein